MTKIYTSDAAFTDAVKAIQERKGSRKGYAKMEQKGGWQDTFGTQGHVVARQGQAQETVRIGADGQADSASGDVAADADAGARGQPAQVQVAPRGVQHQPAQLRIEPDAIADRGQRSALADRQTLDVERLCLVRLREDRSDRGRHRVVESSFSHGLLQPLRGEYREGHAQDQQDERTKRGPHVSVLGMTPCWGG